MATAEELQEIFNREIVRELLGADADEARIDQIWAACQGNPWNAGVLNAILKAHAKLQETDE